MPKIKLLKLIYHLSRIRTKKKKICVCMGERLSDLEFEKYSAIVNQCKQGK